MTWKRCCIHIRNLNDCDSFVITGADRFGRNQSLLSWQKSWYTSTPHHSLWVSRWFTPRIEQLIANSDAVRHAFNEEGESGREDQTLAGAK